MAVWLGSSISLGRRIFYAAVIIAAVPLIYLFVGRGMRFFRVPSNSMEPTILVSDYLVTLRQDNYKRGDVVVLRDPMLGNGYIVKRIIAVGGGVFINGGYASEPYGLEPIDYRMDEYRVNESEVFVLGDNRNRSVDSHDWTADVDDGRLARPGGVPTDLIVGRVLYIYLPFNRMHRLLPYPLRSLGDTA